MITLKADFEWLCGDARARARFVRFSCGGRDHLPNVLLPTWSRSPVATMCNSRTARWGAGPARLFQPGEESTGHDEHAFLTSMTSVNMSNKR